MGLQSNRKKRSHVRTYILLKTNSKSYSGKNRIDRWNPFWEWHKIIIEYDAYKIECNF